MTGLRYRPAADGWLVAAADGLLVVLEPDAGAKTADVWEALGGGDGGFDRVIRVLAADGFDALPQFALVEHDGSRVRLIVRGALTAEVDAAGVSSAPAQRVSGQGLSTWTERAFDDVAAVRLAVDPAPAADRAELPLVSGVVLAAGCVLDLGADASHGTPSTTAPRAAAGAGPTERDPAPEPEPAPGAESEPAPEAEEAAEPEGAPEPGLDPDPGVEEAPGPAPESRPEPAPNPEPGPEPEPHHPTPHLPRRDPSPDDTVSEATVSDLGDDALTGDTVFVPRRRPLPATTGAENPGAATSGATTVGAATAPDVGAPPPWPPPLAAPTAAPDAEATGPSDGAPDPHGFDGDHDGRTILSSDLPRGRPRTEPPPRAQAAAPPVLVLADGSREPLDAPLIVGRAPSATQVSGDRLPRLVTVGGSDPDISRTHARVALEGDSVVVTDLHSRNGTLVVLPGRPPQKLRAGEPTTVIAGTVIDLGGGITFTVGDAAAGA